MFKIEEFLLYSGDDVKKYRLYSNTYVFGYNSSGKTAMWKAIDYALGSSASDIYEYDGLQNVDAIGLSITKESSDQFLFIKRTKNGEYFVRNDKNSAFLKVSSDGYKAEIMRLLNGVDLNYFEIYEEVFEEKLSFRAFSFINLISEKGLGNLSLVFTESSDIKHQMRIRNINSFLFNYDNIKEIYDIQKKIEKIDRQIKDIEEKNAQYVFLLEKTAKIFKLLGMTWHDDIKENKDRFLKFKETFVHNESVPKEDIVYLQKAALSLKEKIKTYEVLKNQTDFLKNRNAKIDYVLGFLKDIANQEEQYSEYVVSIEQTLLKHKKDGEIISLFDYNEAINQIKNELRAVEEKIKRIDMSTAVIDYEKTLKYIGVLETNFESIEEYVYVDEYNTLNETKKSLVEKIKEKKKSMSQRLINGFNEYLTKIYLEADLTSEFATQDKKHDELKICYNPVLGGIYAEKNNKKGEKETYIPGSMARETAWQILTYMAMFKFLNVNFKGLPVLPIILMDAIEQPFVDENITEFYKALRKLSKEIGIQLIIFSKNDSAAFNKDEKINLNQSGLNPFINKV